ncbi:DeoR/GlpR family DNA-binding transcription regulator [Thermoactinomyces mirandus]|uniref:DeoR/GlpR transcriptional regulator n=1 Tax=Thermoactinomyces mirandus TaxID=2756294 RepID=A0A7W1XRX9_9BACL|nr:DeoR/GlpR family DNA-binding transcription regulator [Thermoactinomyces mirandus]MBA4602154.1 DeoR/GlpR transcriptional regulator [Thermoactinomyces mirandus]
MIDYCLLFLLKLIKKLERGDDQTLTPQRHQLILKLLKKQGVVKVQELALSTGASESTIRRDLDQLEQQHLLKRVHGGAALLQSKGVERPIQEKATRFTQAKKEIGLFAAGLVEPGACIYLDAGSTTLEMIPALTGKQVTVVTNGMTHLELLVEYEIESYVLGGKMKTSTRALIGAMALEGIRHYRFDQCFLGTNGIHPDLGYTTPDPEEAILKRTALQLSGQSFVLADPSKLSEISFAKIADLNAASLITLPLSPETKEIYSKKTYVFEVDKA